VTAVAIVDLDNTLIRGSYLFHFGAFLVRRRLLSPAPLLPFLWDEFRFVRDRDERTGIPQRVTEAVLGATRGREQAELVGLCRRFVEESIDRFVVPEVLESVTDLKDLGIPVFVATASPQELATLVADRLGLVGGLGTIAEVVNGRYTGRLATPIMHGPEKLARVQRLSADLGADLSTSWAFSDSINDLPLLSAVGWPVAVNADHKLREVAASRGWLTIQSADDRPENRWAAQWGTAAGRWLRDDPRIDVPMH
jgi:HAD superfamily hydrolase (TIGR01490 family)